MDLRQKLTRLGLLPALSAGLEISAGRIIPDLAAFWQAEAQSRTGPSSGKAARVAAWLEHQLAGGAVAELRSPTSADSSLDLEFGERILWWPHGKPVGRRIAIVSSRIGRKLHEHPKWFETLRLAAAALDDGDSLLTSPGTTTHRFVTRLAELLDIPQVEARMTSPRLLTSNWSDWLKKESAAAADQRASPVFISPPVAALSSESKTSPDRAIPDRDLAVSLLADQTWVLMLREKGHVLSLLSRGLSESVFGPGTVRLFFGEGLITESQARPLQELGAVAWHLSATDASPEQPPRQIPSLAISSRHAASSIQADVDEEEWTWLTHCTRQPGGTWPDESQTDFVDEVLLSEPADRSPLAALLRILSQETLFASGVGIRGEFPVVCFSASPLNKLLQNRTWQRHRTRWDFEPFGICICQAVLEKLGAQPVEYGDDEAWTMLSEERRPWFQKESSQVGSRTVDWSVEQEWRVRGDLDLSQIEPDDAFVFVPTEAAAVEVRAVSRWPVVVVGGLLEERKRNRRGTSSGGA